MNANGWRTLPTWAALLCAAGLLVSHAEAQEDRRLPQRPGEQAAQERRLALVVGNNTYLKAPLRNPVNDARAVAVALRDVGFTVTEALDVSRPQLERAIDTFVAQLTAGDVALFFYAGHGFQLEGENYLVPVDFAATDLADARYEAYSASRVHDKITAKGVRLVVLVLDACRDNPFQTARSTNAGWAMMGAGQGIYIAFATAPGDTASDDPVGTNGLFTRYFVQALREPGLRLDDVFNRVRAEVVRASSNRQVPWTTSSVVGDFVFRPAVSVPAAAQPRPDDASVALRAEITYWESIRDSREAALFEAYLRRFPQGLYAELARARLVETNRATPAQPVQASPPPAGQGGAPSSKKGAEPLANVPAVPVASTSGTRSAPTPTPPSNPSAGTSWFTPSDGREMVWIPSGQMQLGSPASEGGRFGDETPHAAGSTSGFWLDATEITNAAYQKFLSARPEWRKERVTQTVAAKSYLDDWVGTQYPAGKEDHPVLYVSWYAARAYCGWAAKRLPTEAEWEYAARAGSTGPRWWDAHTEAAPFADARRGTTPVDGPRSRNPWRLADALGSVWQWTSSVYRGYPYRANFGHEDSLANGARVLRGGFWGIAAGELRVAVRFRLAPVSSVDNVGFRCAR